MTYLVDTNVLSEIRRGNAAAIAWIKTVHPDEVFLSVITLGEIVRGITILTKRDAPAAASINTWLENLRRNYAGQILGIDEAVALEWGRLSAHRTLPVADGLIVATASLHRLTIVTRNIKDFAETGVPVFNPMAGAERQGE